MSLLGCVHSEDGNKRKMPSIWKQTVIVQGPLPVPISLFLNRAQSADEGEAESWGSDPPRGQKFFSDVQLFCLHKKRAVVPTKS